MADLETIGVETPEAPKPKRKYTRRKKWNRKASRKVKLFDALEKEAPPAESTDVFAGLTHSACAIACNVERCVITGQPMCGHPHLQGLQERFKQSSEENNEIQARFKGAQLYLHHLAAEAKKPTI